MVFYIAFLLINWFVVAESHRLVVFSIGTILSALNLLFLFTGFITINKKRESISKSFDYYVEKVIATTGIGLISFNDDGNINWISDFVAKRVSHRLIGKKISTISKSFNEGFKSGQRVFIFKLEGTTYNARVNVKEKTVVIKDITHEDILLAQYTDEKLVIGEMQIDNFQQFQLTLSEEELFRIHANVISMLDSISTKFNVVYRQYANGKYLIITDHVSLQKFIDAKFNFLDSIRKIEVIDGINLTVSIGFGSDSPSQKTLLEMSKDGLLQSQARGGDQVTILASNLKPTYYGSKTQIAKTVSRVKTKKIAELLEGKMKSNKIKTVIIYGHKYADLDAIGAALGAASIAKTFKKEVYIQNLSYDNTTSRAIDGSMDKELKKIFIKPTKANQLAKAKETLVIIVDTAEIGRIENPRAFVNVNPENIFVFDHHRLSDLPKDIVSSNTYIDTSASSASEILVEIMNLMTTVVKLPNYVAQMLLNGIYLDTAGFKKQTSSRTYDAASFLQRQGASSEKSTDILKIPQDAAKILNKIIAGIKEVKPGYYLSTYNEVVGADIISMAADEILRTQGRVAAFVIAKLPGSQNLLKLSARSIDVNIQKIVEEVGGGGHFNASAATSNESIVEFADNVVQAIISRSDN